ncbi:MAG: hypothetical protein ACAH11_11155 [Sphingomonas sp.]
MKIRTMIGAALALGLSLAVPTQGVLAGGGEVWTVAAAPNGAFSVETPCDANEVAGMAYIPEDSLPGVSLDKEKRVICFKDKMMFMGAVMAPGNPPRGTTVFDMLVESLAGTESKGKPMQTTIGGRRAMVNRAVEDGVVAQTGFVELNPREIIFLFGGGENDRLSVAAQGAAIDRFFASTKVTAQ